MVAGRDRDDGAAGDGIIRDGTVGDSEARRIADTMTSAPEASPEVADVPWPRPQSEALTDEFDYDLPPELVAQAPVEPRDASRLLVIDCATAGLTHRAFRDLPDLLDPGDVLVVNDSRVIAARLHARRPTGGRAELLLLRPVLHLPSPPGRGAGGEGEDEGGWSPWWEALVRPANRLRAGQVLVIESPLDAASLSREAGEGSASLSRRSGGGTEGGGSGGACADDDGPSLAVSIRESPTAPARAEVGPRLASGGIAVRFDRPVDEVTVRHGDVPLPPYVRQRLVDGSRYQTVYARETGSAAAPTAGLHFTPALLESVRARGVEVVPVTLHVGADTFLPVRVDRIADHPMHAEYAVVPDATAAVIARARREGRRVTCVGTTAVRATESWARAHGAARADLPATGWHGWTRLFLVPGAPFLVADALVTNFHVPRSTLLMLVSAFAGMATVRAAYAAAIGSRYRFYSFGDACLFR